MGRERVFGLALWLSKLPLTIIIERHSMIIANRIMHYKDRRERKIYTHLLGNFHVQFESPGMDTGKDDTHLPGVEIKKCVPWQLQLNQRSQWYREMTNAIKFPSRFREAL